MKAVNGKRLRITSVKMGFMTLDEYRFRDKVEGLLETHMPVGLGDVAALEGSAKYIGVGTVVHESLMAFVRASFIAYEKEIERLNVIIHGLRRTNRKLADGILVDQAETRADQGRTLEPLVGSFSDRSARRQAAVVLDALKAQVSSHHICIILCIRLSCQ